MGDHVLLLGAMYTQDNETLNNDALHLLPRKLSTLGARTFGTTVTVLH
jgi:hypothetical protein